MAERSCRPAFSLPFHGLIVARQIDFSDEVPDQFNLLPAVSAGFVRRMDDNLLYKLIDDGGRQFTNAHIFPYNGCKAVKVGFILFKGFYRLPPRFDLLCHFLFRLIIRRSSQESFMAYFAAESDDSAAFPAAAQCLIGDRKPTSAHSRGQDWAFLRLPRF